ncbi:hypothetical protein BDQ17DRAFT_1373052 [Cyathus striatus]|nr:hypothetical protein BDQ17DRAFT_1385727 [Cyathus striatus]KAF8989565.1 hypothetical protein BDQ17DRAFT_1373052 [Cyathus striatus]
MGNFPTISSTCLQRRTSSSLSTYHCKYRIYFISAFSGYFYAMDDEMSIRDINLNALMVETLPHGAILMVLFDSCHSGTLLG